MRREDAPARSARSRGRCLRGEIGAMSLTPRRVVTGRIAEREVELHAAARGDGVALICRKADYLAPMPRFSPVAQIVSFTDRRARGRLVVEVLFWPLTVRRVFKQAWSYSQ